MTIVELLPEGAERVTQDATSVFRWPLAVGRSVSVESDLDSWLTQLGVVEPGAIDLLRVAAGAFLADRASPRGVGFSRSIVLHVHVLDPDVWANVVHSFARLLHWLTADEWTIVLHPDARIRPNIAAPEGPSPDAVSLMSGGLDSFCGALLAETQGRRLVHVGHWDNPLTKHAQDNVKAALIESVNADLKYQQIRFRELASHAETSSRSRSILFVALAVAVASGLGTTRVEVPENGFTSLNPPLGPERGGALSTRSTHPLTIFRINEILEGLQLNVRLTDPFSELTKGELVQTAKAAGVARFEDAAARTLSCGKLDGARYKGGNANHHCGLCVPCLVRRASMLAANVEDRTPYLSGDLSGEALRHLQGRRASDVEALKRALKEGFADETLLAMGPFPPAYDLDRAYDLCRRGYMELALVPLP